MIINFINSGNGNPTKIKIFLEMVIASLLVEDMKISESGSRGGYFSRFIVTPNQPLLLSESTVCGTFAPEKSSEYFYNSFEKAQRLNDHIYKGHVTSFQSQVPHKQEWPGAVYVEEDKKIFSFSGLSPQWDEFMSVMASCYNLFRNRKALPFEHAVMLYSERAKLITASNEDHEQMLKVANQVFLVSMATKVNQD